MNPYPDSAVNWRFALLSRFKVFAEFHIAQACQQWLIVNDFRLDGEVVISTEVNSEFCLYFKMFLKLKVSTIHGEHVFKYILIVKSMADKVV